MRHAIRVCAAALMLMALAACVAQPVTKSDDSASTPDIAFTRFRLDNGLTVIVHEDHKAPVVAVNIWYHVGSRNEKAGHTGFAHLFEHLMFNGSEHYNDDFFKPFSQVGTTDQNGTTNTDRTNFFETVPSNALDLALWMESDRMGYLAGAIDQARLDEQRGVVENEKRQDENRPYGEAFNQIVEHTYPAAHPYSHPVIGSMADLDAASVDDVKQWFHDYYGAANAVLSIAGDVDTATIRKKVAHYFGEIPSGPPVQHMQEWTARRTGKRVQVMQDRVPAPRVYMAWNVPGLTSKQVDYLDMVGDILSSGKSSRLYKRLVYDDKLASSVQAGVFERELGSQFMVIATVLPGKDIKQVEAAIHEELARFLKNGPTADELQRTKAGYLADFVRGIERVGGFGGISDILASSQVYAGDPAFYKVRLERHRQASAADLEQAARDWLGDGEYLLEVVPFGPHKASASKADRSKLPKVGAYPEITFPRTEATTLSNGLRVILAHRDAVPVINFRLLLDAGYAADQFARPGTATLAMYALDEGTSHRTGLEISDELHRLGTHLSADSNLDLSDVSMSTLKRNLDPSLDLFADVVLHPSFPADQVARLKSQQIAGIQREKQSPVQMALRVFPKLLYGEGHAYSMPFTGSGYVSSVTALTPADLKQFHDTWFKPNHATLVVVGDTTMAAIKPRLEKLFGEWKAGDVPRKNIAHVPPATKPTVYLLNRPDSKQSVIFAGNIAPPTGAPNNIAIETMNDILGGEFTSRINMNLREDKHWAYGAYSVLPDAEGQRPFLVYAPVQTDKTAESMREIDRELHAYVKSKPATAAELTRAKNSQTRSLPGRWETAGAVAGSIAEQVRFHLPANYWDTYATHVRGLDLEQVRSAADDVLRPDALTWIVVGDLARIEPAIRKLGLGEIHYIDANGNPVPGGH
ncbi:MAG: pitrilysin family protein [Gammaproteobacteria bacterium]